MCSLWRPPKAPPWLQSLAEPPPTAPSPPPFASGVSSPTYQTSVTTVLSNHCCNCLETSFSCLPLLLLLLLLLRAMFRAPLSPGDSLLCLLKARTSDFCAILTIWEMRRWGDTWSASWGHPQRAPACTSRPPWSSCCNGRQVFSPVCCSGTCPCNRPCEEYTHVNASYQMESYSCKH